MVPRIHEDNAKVGTVGEGRRGRVCGAITIDVAIAGSGAILHDVN